MFSFVTLIVVSYISMASIAVKTKMNFSDFSNNLNKFYLECKTFVWFILYMEKVLFSLLSLSHLLKWIFQNDIYSL